jgi:hypothetical protein
VSGQGVVNLLAGQGVEVVCSGVSLNVIQKSDASVVADCIVPEPTIAPTVVPPTPVVTMRPSPTGAAEVGQVNPVTCMGYPEPRVYLETQSWWEPVPDLGGQGHIHHGLCWPLGQTVSGVVRLDFRALFHDNIGKITKFNVQDDQSRDYNFDVNIPVDSTKKDVLVEKTLYIDSGLQEDGLRQWRLYVYFEHLNGDNQRTKLNYLVRVENGKPDTTRPVYDNFGGARWYKEIDGTDWGYQIAEIKPNQFPFECPSGIWSVDVKLGQSGTTKYYSTIDPNFHAGNVGTMVKQGVGGSFSGKLAVDTRTLKNGDHKLVLQTARRVGNEENGSLFVVPFKVCN